MTEHPDETRLDAYVEDLLDARSRIDVEAHLAGCARCRAEVASMRELLGAMRALPREADPGVDLRPAIRATRAARADAEARRRWLRSLRVPLAAAAALLVLVSAGVTALVLHGGPTGPGEARSTQPQVQLASFDAERDYYVRSADRLAAVLASHRDELAPETVALVEENLRTIDRALAEAEAALRADSASPVVRDLILATHEQKVEVLRWATSLTRS